MDPYLEPSHYWPDFHASFVTYLSDALNSALPDDYVAELNERFQLVPLVEGRPRKLHPESSIAASAPPRLAVAAPAEMGRCAPTSVPFPMLYIDLPRETYIEVFHLPHRSLVATLELLSPYHKSEPGRSDYCTRRNAAMLRNVHLVELDLLVGGSRLPAGKPSPPADYYALVSRGNGKCQTEVYSWNLRQPLPRLPVPLLAPDSDLWFDLGAVFTTAYDRGRYARRLDYEKPPGLPISEADQNWVAEQLKATRS